MEHPLGPADEKLLTDVANALQTAVYAPQGAASSSSHDRDDIALTPANDVPSV
jgi:hypothetical protein